MRLLNSPTMSPIQVGREPGMALIEHTLVVAVGRAGQCAPIAGAAGLCQSRLLAELRARAAARIFMVLRGCCCQQNTSISNAPLPDALRTHAAPSLPLPVLDGLGRLAPVLLNLLPHLAIRLPELAPSPTLESQAERRRLFEALAQDMTALAAGRPVLVVIEDIHRGDDTGPDRLPPPCTRRLLAKCQPRGGKCPARAYSGRGGRTRLRVCAAAGTHGIDRPRNAVGNVLCPTTVGTGYA